MSFAQVPRRALILVFALGLIISGALGAVITSHYGASLSTTFERFNTMGPLRIHAVADGDTLTVNPWFGKPRSVRLLGINTPELPHAGLRIQEQCFGKEAADYVRSIATHKYAVLVYDPLKSMHDDRGRLLAYVHIYSGYSAGIIGASGLDLNKDLIEKGFAEEWQFKGRYTRGAEFLAAETKAQADNAGGWALCPDFKRHPRTRRR